MEHIIMEIPPIQEDHQTLINKMLMFLAILINITIIQISLNSSLCIMVLNNNPTDHCHKTNITFHKVNYNKGYYKQMQELIL